MANTSSEQIPEKCMEIETITKSLYDIFQKDRDDKPLYFDSTISYSDIENNKLKYRIPAHQRYGSLDWKEEKKQKLIDSIFKGYPIQGITTSKHNDNSSEWLEIEDGATRLTILQEYYMNKFRYCGKIFNDLDERHRMRFNNYKLNIDVIKCTSPEDISYSFDRLNSGKPLTDADRYYALKSLSPFVKKAFELIEKPYCNRQYMNTRTFSDKKRKILPEICAIVATIAWGTEYTSVSSKRLYDVYFRELPDDIDARLESFFEHYNKIISNSFSNDYIGNKKIIWSKTSKILGLIMHDFIEPDSISVNIKRKMWSYIIKLAKTVPNFMFGEETIWNGLNKANQRNCLPEDFKARLTRIREIYNVNTRNSVVRDNNIVIE